MRRLKKPTRGIDAGHRDRAPTVIDHRHVTKTTVPLLFSFILPPSFPGAQERMGTQQSQQQVGFVFLGLMGGGGRATAR